MSSITIKYKFENIDDGKYCLKLWTHESSNNIQPEIFLVSSVSAVPENVYSDYKFIRTATYADMMNHVTVNNKTDVDAFFRVSNLIIQDDSLFYLNTKLKQIQENLDSLINDIVNINTSSEVLKATVSES